MSSSSFLTDPRVKLVADASVIINLNATARTVEIIKAAPNPFVVTENACAELEIGARNGHDDYRKLTELIDAGLIQRVRLGAADAPIYESLIDGSAARTLDDGEAATIAYPQPSALRLCRPGDPPPPRPPLLVATPVSATARRSARRTASLTFRPEDQRHDQRSHQFPPHLCRLSCRLQ